MDLRYLKWDGIYSLDGRCNVVHAPIDPNDPASAWSRLRALGFDLGAADLADDAGRKAVRRYLAMVSVPATVNVRLRLRVTTSACTLTVAIPVIGGETILRSYVGGLTDHDDEFEVPGTESRAWSIQLRGAAPAFATLNAGGRQSDEWRPLQAFDSRAARVARTDADGSDYEAMPPKWDTSKAERQIFSDYPAVLDATALQALAALDDCAITTAPPPTPPPATSSWKLFGSRSTAERVGTGAVVQLPDIAVKVRRTPKSLRPFAELGFVQIKLEAAHLIESMMLRVYRNFEAATGIGPQSADQLVYQEVLARSQIDALVRTVPDANTYLAALGGARGGILQRQILEEDGERFAGSSMCAAGAGVRAFDRSHAPYKFKVWISSDAHAFDSAKITGRPAAAVSRRSSIDLSADELPLIIDVTNPAPTATLVHDEAKAAPSQPTGLVGQADWPSIARDPNAASFRKNKFWTSRAQLGKSLCGVPCATHGPSFLATNAEQPDDFVAAFEKDAWTEYQTVCAQRIPDNTGPDFTFAPFAGCCAEIERHLARIEQRVCCGAYSSLPTELKNAIATATAAQKTAFATVRSTSYPYRETFNTIERFVNFWNAVVGATTGRDEYLLYRLALEHASPAVAAAYGTDARRIVNLRRNDLGGHRILEGGVTVVQDAGAFKLESGRSSVTNSGTTLPHSFAAKHTAYKNDCRCGGELLLYPSYAPLSLRFFIAVRAAPLWVLALIDLPYIIADRNYMQPYSFFEHDMFHATDGTTRQQWVTLYEARNDHIEHHAATAREVHELWQANCQTLLVEIDKSAGSMKKALELIFFYLLHEPVDNAEIAARAPAVPEKKALRTRLAMAAKPDYGGDAGGNFFLQELEHKLDTKFFGDRFDDIRGDLVGAYARAGTICDALKTTTRDA